MQKASTKSLKDTVKQSIVERLRRFRSSKLGRRIDFNTLPQNLLAISETADGLIFAVHPRDRAIGRDVFIEKRAYDSHLVDAVFATVQFKNPPILYDVGANIGTIGIYAVSKGYAAKCIAFEPDPTNFTTLKINVLLNGMEEDMELINCALSSQAEDAVEFELSSSNFGDHRVRITDEEGKFEEAGRRTILVPTEVLDTFWDTKSADDAVIFMDTQGFEGHILDGASNLVAAGAPLVTEFWPYGLQRSGGLERFYSALETAPYQRFADLRKSNALMDFSIDAVQAIAKELGNYGDYSELLFVAE
ncbi:MAG: FkbM family methyltransferase [Pseudomonadota bacterium]